MSNNYAFTALTHVQMLHITLKSCY